MRLLTISAAFLALAGAFALFGLKHDTRRIEAGVIGRERALEKLRLDIAILEAERAHLAAPDRIERLARAQGLGPIAPHQYAREDEVLPLRTVDASTGNR